VLPILLFPSYCIFLYSSSSSFTQDDDAALFGLLLFLTETPSWLVGWVAV
jgi:hypothetical protein